MARITLTEDDLGILRLLMHSLEQGQSVALLDDEAACSALALHRDTYLGRLRRLARAGAISYAPLARGPRRPDPRRRIVLHLDHFLFAGLGGGAA